MDGEKIERLTIQQAKEIAKAIRSQAQNKIENYRGINYNPNTKGEGFEKAVLSLLKDYLDSRFDFYNRAQLIDPKIEYLKVFDGKSSEMDVAATFKNVVPKIIIKLGDTNFLPYDAVAFIVETKLSLEGPKLKEDLEKLQKIGRFQSTASRFDLKINFSKRTKYVVLRPLRVLVYYSAKISESKLEKLLDENIETWDSILVLKEDRLIINKSLLAFEIFYQAFEERFDDEDKFIFWVTNAFIMFLFLIALSTPAPLTVNVISTFFKLASLQYKQ